MEKFLLLVTALAIVAWAVPKPMESIENYNVLMVHGAYGAEKGFENSASEYLTDSITSSYRRFFEDSLEAADPQFFEMYQGMPSIMKDGIWNSNIPKEMYDSIERVHYAFDAGYDILSAYDRDEFLGNATLGGYDSDDRITKWLSMNVFEEPDIGKERNPRNSYIYNWRSFSNPANSSYNNAYELADRTWNKGNKPFHQGGFGHRRALMEEAQEVKAEFVNDSGKVSYGQAALEIMRHHPDLYRQLASRYILIGHSMGGVVSREYVQGNFYNGDVDKIITLDSPHEGTGALNMLIKEAVRLESAGNQAFENFYSAIPMAAVVATPFLLVKGSAATIKASLIMLGASFAVGELGNVLTRLAAPEIYYYDDPLVGYVDPQRKGYQTIDSLNSLPYRQKIDSLPMFRILASQNSMTFSDPALLDYGMLDFVRYLVPNNFTLPLANFGRQLEGSGDISTRNSNAFTAMMLGFAGIPVQDYGSNIVPAASSEGRNVDVLNDSEMDVERAYFNAAAYSTGTIGDISFVLETAADAIMLIDYTVGMIFPEGADAAKLALGVSSAALAVSSMGTALGAGIADLVSSHSIPLEKESLDTMKVSKNTFSPIGSSAGSSYTPYLMEDFLYERPFVNLALNDSKTMDSLSKMSVSARESSTLNRNCFYGADVSDTAQFCEIGLYGKIDSLVARSEAPKDSSGKFIYNGTNDKGDSIYNDTLQSYGSFKRQNYADFQDSPLKFHSSSDWSSIGMKMDRWEKVDGLTPDGDLAPKSVPIRHVERYNVPAITVDNWIEKYSFVVDDLMPHRLRQIRMNFNYQEEIAWECDVTKDPDANDACSVFKRSGGGNWKLADSIGNKGYVPHPVKKNGQFDFVPADYGYNNLLAIQKDNQNTVTISTVNKIGLSNTQRFYYLFKATDNLLVPIWPKLDVVVNGISGFKANASVLDYQGFSVVGMRDSMWYMVDDASHSLGDWQDMDFLGKEGSGDVFGSRKAQPMLDEGEYHWVFNAIIRNEADAGNDSSDIYDVPFRVDVSVPDFNLSVDDLCMNPDSAMFIAGFAWKDTATIPDIRMMRWQLERWNGQGYSLVEDLPSLYDVTSKDFKVAWEKVAGRGGLADGLYRIKATAIDNAVPSAEAYDYVSELVPKIAIGTDSENDWAGLDNFNLNRVDRVAEFRVDRTAPSLSFVDVGGFPYDSLSTEKYAGLSRPPRDANLDYVSDDSLLHMEYAVEELLGGRDSTPVTILWNFIQSNDTTRHNRVGDSVWIRDDDNVGFGSWTEMAGLRLQDGDYTIRSIVRDEAKNTAYREYGRMVRIDRTAPKIVSLVTSRLVYPDSVRDFSATLSVSETGDVATNRTGMRCHYRVLGGDGDNLWRDVDDEILGNGSVKFDVSAEAVGSLNGKRYLEVVCLDAAGNSSVRTDLFHVGVRYPEIAYPIDDDEYLNAEYVPIVGIAPPTSVSAENSTTYRLRYRFVDSDEWMTENISVVSSNRSIDSANISRNAQSTEGVLGYLHNVGFAESAIYIELSTRSCPTCAWISDSSRVTVSTEYPGEESQNIVFELSSTTMEVGRDSLETSLWLTGDFKGDYLLRVYAEDSRGVGLFDKLAERIFANPFYGEPADTSMSEGVWFYEKDGLYHLQWRGLLDGDSIEVIFDSKNFGGTCLAPDGLTNVAKGCNVLDRAYDFSTIEPAVEQYLSGYPVWQRPSHVDKAMVLFGNAGHIAMQSAGAFHVGLVGANAFESSIPVYFGSYKEGGFAFLDSENPSISPWMTGWTVNPNAYRLNFVWDGTSSTRSYPSAGTVKIHAEIVQNVRDNPYVVLMDTSVTLVIPEMDVALSAPSEFYIIDNSTDSSDVDTGEVKLYELGSMNIPYGILYRDAFVSVKITDGDGNVVKSLMDSVYTKAHTDKSAYSVLWDAKDSDGFAVNPGVYYVVLSAVAADGSGNKKSATTSFKVSLKKMVPDVSNGVNLVVSEAFDDGGKHRYVPVPDYLVSADIAVKYLTQEKRNGVTINVDASGTQKIYGYAPKRFSLAIKRHRKQLDLVVVRRLHGWVQEITGQFPYESCESHTPYLEEMYYVDTLSFSSEKKSNKLTIEKNYDGRGFAQGEYYDKNYLDIIVFSLSNWEKFKRDHGWKADSSSFKAAKDIAEWTLSNNLTTDVFVIPKPSSKRESILLDASIDSRCELDVDEVGRLLNTCSEKKKDYNPNKNMFVVKMTTKEDSLFYSYWYSSNSHCDSRKRYAYLAFDVELTIPDSYWDAPFGMDNLVNRTIRFDHKNTTIYAESQSSTDGYWAALMGDELKDNPVIGEGSYFDGTTWKFNKTYGLLTPYEMQALPFLPASVMPGGKNTFLFADEDSAHPQPAYFDMKFYGPRDSTDYFQAIALGVPQETTNGCDYDNKSNYDAAYQLAINGQVNSPRCQISVTSKIGGPDSVRTPLFDAGYVYFYVGRNMKWSKGNEKTIAFPAPANVLATISGKCDENEYLSEVKETANCYKYYKGGSKIHYYLDDFDDPSWISAYTKNGIIRNPVNAPADYYDPEKTLNLDTSRLGSATAIKGLFLRPSTSDYENGSFFVCLDTVAKLKGEKNGYSVTDINIVPSFFNESEFTVGDNRDTLYFNAIDTVFKNRIYRDRQNHVPTQITSSILPMELIYNSTNSWAKEPKVDSISILHLDSTEHSHFTITSSKDWADRTISFKDAKDVKVARPKELVELRANLTAGQKYQLSYLKGEAYYVIKDTFATVTGAYRLAWFDVNRLQGNTQFLLTWGGENDKLYYSSYNLYVGTKVNVDSVNTVESLFGELSVTFPTGSMHKSEEVTVRTADVSDYPFNVYNNVPLTGPIMEVLPSMTFEDTTRLPRIQMRISRSEMEAKGVTPQTLKLYKVDFENKKFVPLQNALYGYLDGDGSSALSTGLADSATCGTWDSEKCYPGEGKWEYILISAETKTFSVFAAMSSMLADIPDFSVEILPEIAAVPERILNVRGTGNYSLYVDDDSLWNEERDATPAVPLSYTIDSEGFATVTLPRREGVIDTNYVFVVARSVQDSLGNSVELPAAPAVARALTVSVDFSCSVPSDSLWLGLDNGYLAYGAECNHPGVGTVSLYSGERIVVEIHGDIPDTILYDGARTLGKSSVGKIAPGIYESRYLGISALGFEQQIAGPLVYTDSLRPVVEGFTVQESSDVLDRIFTVSARVADSESGVASVTLTPEFGGIRLSTQEMLPDSAGNVSTTFRLTRGEISECVGCKLRMMFRAEDFGHNHADTTYVSDRLYPYPATLALWYPAREGTGAKAYEFLNGEHDLELSSVQNPWQSDAGIYFGAASDHAVGSGRVDLGTTDSYTLEFRMKRGNAPDVWRDIISFTGPGNLSIRLLQKGRSLSLSEGGREWISGDVLPALTKSWAHVAVVSDADGVRFYVDGTPVKFVPGGISADRELYGSLTLGSASGNSFVGNIADVRFYTGALTGSEIAYLSMPATDNGNLSNVIVVSVKDVNVMNGFSGRFSCAVAGNRYLEAGGDASRLRMNVFVEKAGDYQVVVYARSANLSSAEVSVGEGTVVSGTLALSGVWRASALSGAALHLSRGTHSILLEAPTGVQIGGIALSEATISPAMIAWGRGLTGMDMEAQSPSKIQTSLKYEGFLDRSMLRPRIRLKNVSGETVNGYSVRYYFRGEDPTQVQTSAFFPQNSVDLQIHSESARTGYAEWDFNGFVLAPNDSAFYGEGPHFGLYNADWSPWNAEDDPSFVTAAMDGYALDEGIVVLDRDNNLIGGRCAEMEDEASIVVKSRVLASDTRNDNQASEIHFTVENLGNTALRDFEVRYYFHVEEGLAPIMDINYLSACSTAELESLGSGRFQVRVRCRGSIGAGNAMNDPVNISLHLSGWANIWNASDDPGHVGLSTSMAEARGICVFDSLGNRIYGDDPSWPETSIVAGASNGNPETLDNGYHGDVSIPIVRTEDGLVLSLDSWTTLSLDLVNAIGIPVKSIFNGTLQPGEQLVAVDWTGINPRTTYLVLKINGTIKATKLLSLL